MSCTEIDNEGRLLNQNYDEVQLDNNNDIKLAHLVLLHKNEITFWQTHFKNHKIKPLFNQLYNTMPHFDSNADRLNDFQGYTTDSFTLRSVLTKMGYQRGEIGDGGGFDTYVKSYNHLGIYVLIKFSGSAVPEDNIPVALHELAFQKQGVSSAPSVSNTGYIPLKNINPVLLTESYAEYQTMADASNGFDSKWKRLG